MAPSGQLRNRYWRIGGPFGRALMPLIRARHDRAGEDFHIGFSWCIFASYRAQMESLTWKVASFGTHTNQSARMEAGAFVLSACGYMTSNDFHRTFVAGHCESHYAHGGIRSLRRLAFRWLRPPRRHPFFMPTARPHDQSLGRPSSIQWPLRPTRHCSPAILAPAPTSLAIWQGKPWKRVPLMTSRPWQNGTIEQARAGISD